MLKLDEVEIEFISEVIGPFNGEIDDNQIVAIIGESGAGKSTLVKAITNTIKDYKGNISFKHKPITQDLFMYITQKGTLFNHLTIKDNLLLTIDNLKEVGEVFEELNLPIDYLDKYPFELSGGECQRVDLTRAILAETKILILDEVFSALDSKTKDDTYDILKQLQNKHKMLILFITHDLQETIFLAHEILLIKDGKIVFKGTGKDLVLSNNENVHNLISQQKMDLLRSAYANNK